MIGEKKKREIFLRVYYYISTMLHWIEDDDESEEIMRGPARSNIWEKERERERE